MRRQTLERLTAMRREDRVLVRALDVESGEESLIDPASDISPLGLAAASAVAAEVSRRIRLDGRDWFLTVYDFPFELVIVGAVHIAQALAALAAPAGYRVRVIDPRDAYAGAGRFAGLALERDWPDAALAARPLTRRSALVVLAHDAKLDDTALAAGLRSPAFYLGALGSRRTHVRRLARLEAQGFSWAELGRIHGPVGLTIGARSPAEIAIAILAETVQCRRTPAVRRVGGVVLAAGTSSRMGRNKLVAELAGKPLLRHAVEEALASRLDPVIVVTGHDAAAAEKALVGLPVLFAHNDAFAQGLSTSLHRGFAALPADCDGGLVLLGDMPGVTAALIDRTIAAFDPAQGRAICAATAGGRHGHPVLWGRQFFSEIAALSGDSGARALLAAHAGAVCAIAAADDAPLIDIDTPEALDIYRQRLTDRTAPETVG